MQNSARLFSVAPMIDTSNHHFRHLMRLITKKAVLYTEMIHQNAIINNHQVLLPFEESQNPVVLQIGGSEPQKLAHAAAIAESYGYQEINFNVGCPSPRVQKGEFGAGLMKNPQLVRQCMQAIKKAVRIPCTIKCRLGVDNFDSYQFISDFLKQLSQGETGTSHFIIHARKAYLKGLNPIENRTVPPLMYERVWRLKQDFPHLKIEINGGIKSVADGMELVKQYKLEGCMVGRLAMQNPFQLRKVDQYFSVDIINKSFEDKRDEVEQRRQIMFAYADYLEKLSKNEITDAKGNKIRPTTKFVAIKPFINFYHGQVYSGKFRNYFSDLSKLKDEPIHKQLRENALIMAEKAQNSLKLQQHNSTERQSKTKEPSINPQ